MNILDPKNPTPFTIPAKLVFVTTAFSALFEKLKLGVLAIVSRAKARFISTKISPEVPTTQPPTK